MIKDEREMDRFIKFLIAGINTIDGRTGTAQFFIEAATLSEIQKQEKRLNKPIRKKREAIKLSADEEYDESL